MDGAKTLSIDSAIAKGEPGIEPRPDGQVSPRGLSASPCPPGHPRDRLTNLQGGLPIVVQEHVIGSIGSDRDRRAGRGGRSRGRRGAGRSQELVGGQE